MNDNETETDVLLAAVAKPKETITMVSVDELSKWARSTNNSRVIEVISSAIYHLTHKPNEHDHSNEKIKGC